MELQDNNSYAGGVPSKTPLPPGISNDPLDSEEAEMPLELNITESEEERLLGDDDGTSKGKRVGVSTVGDLTKRLESITTQQPKPKRDRLSGAARKRYRYFIKQGIDPAVAREQCKKPLVQDGTGKRNRSDDSIPMSTNKKQREEEAQAPSEQTRTFREVVRLERLAICDRNYPNTLLTTEQMTSIGDEIMELVLEQETKEVKPSFEGCSHKPGYVVLSCASKETAQWVRGIISRVKPWEGADLLVMEEDEIPRPEIYILYLPAAKEENTDKILRRIRSQNSELRTYEWKVLNRGEEGNRVILTVSVDSVSSQRLKDRRLQIAWLYGKASVRPKRQARPGAGAEQHGGENPTANAPSTSSNSAGVEPMQIGDELTNATAPSTSTTAPSSTMVQVPMVTGDGNPTTSTPSRKKGGMEPRQLGGENPTAKAPSTPSTAGHKQKGVAKDTKVRVNEPNTKASGSKPPPGGKPNTKTREGDRKTKTGPRGSRKHGLTSNERNDLQPKSGASGPHNKAQ